MHRFKALLSIGVLSLLGSCALSNFEDLEAETWVVSVEETGIAGFGKGLVSSGDSSSFSYVVLGNLPPTALTVSFDAEGKRADNEIGPILAADTVVGSETLEEMTIAVNDQDFGNVKGNVAVGLVSGNQAHVLLLGSVPIKVAGGREPTGIALDLRTPALLSIYSRFRVPASASFLATSMLPLRAA